MQSPAETHNMITADTLQRCDCCNKVLLTPRWLQYILYAPAVLTPCRLADSLVCRVQWGWHNTAETRPLHEFQKERQEEDCIIV